MNKRSLFAELRHRNVYRPALIYAAAAWALAQGIAQLGPAVGLPDWVVRWFLTAAIIGFPFWIALAWFYELTPEGLKHDDQLSENERARHHASSRKVDFWVIGCMAVIIVLLSTNQFVLHRDATSRADQADAGNSIDAASIPANSVAVLPFANEGGDPDQQYFSDGLAEELITDLTRIGGLKVIGKYSSFKFRDSRDAPAAIGAALGVANLIEGSVRQSGQRLRVNVNLFRARDGASVWAQTYDKPIKDVFAIQDEIGRAVAAALQVKLLGNQEANEEQPPGGNVDAYRLMLQGRAQARRFTRTDVEHGITLLEQAVKLDPDYAYAWAVLANYRINLGLNFLSGKDRERVYQQAREDLDRAGALAPDAVTVLLNQGYLLSVVDDDAEGALRDMQRAADVAPGDGTAMNFLAYQLARMGQLQRAADLYQKAIATDPLRADWYANLAQTLTQLGRYADAEQVARKTVAMQSNPDNYLNLALALDNRGQTEAATEAVHQALELQPDYPGGHAQLVVLDVRRGDIAAAHRDAADETDANWKTWALALADQADSDRQQADTALAAYLAEFGKDAARDHGIADLYAVRKEPDPMFMWLQRGVAARDPETTTSLLSDTLLIPYRGDPRFVALCRQLDLPVPQPGGDTDPTTP